MKLITLHPDADAELTEAAQYYESREPGLGSDFLGEVERALDQILANPESFQRIGRRVRRKSLWRFPYNVMYAVSPERIRIVAFAHQKRRPFYWRKRLKNKAEPFEPLVPNSETIEAMRAARRGDVVTVGSPGLLLSSLNADD